MNGIFLASVIGTLFVSFLGIAEYLMYERSEKEKASILSKLYLLGMLLLGLFGLLGLSFIGMGISLSAAWGGFSVVFVTVALLVIIQYRMHQKMGIDKSPLRRRFSSENQSNEEEEDSQEESEETHDVLGYKD